MTSEGGGRGGDSSGKVGGKRRLATRGDERTCIVVIGELSLSSRDRHVIVAVVVARVVVLARAAVALC